MAIAFVLYGFTQTVVSSFDGKPVPESYQARQITITVRTIVSGLAYLATFVYAANGTGLCALAAQKWLTSSRAWTSSTSRRRGGRRRKRRRRGKSSK